MNMLKKITLLIILLFLLSFYTNLIACTTAIVSGKYTSDGRPLLYKHRDSGYSQNRLQHFTDGKYSYIGLVNSVDTLGNEVWMGCNSAGFAIMNSASYNLIEKDTVDFKDREGEIMKAALQNCKTLQDFENLLNQLPKPLGVEANFGVIDSKGGVAYYETDNFSFKKFDANDPKIAPFGYIIRTNYSFCGDQDEGYGYIRYLAAENLFYEAAAANNLNHKFILQKVSRNLKHSLTGIDLTETLPKERHKQKFVNFQDFIPRYSSVSSMVIQGVKKGEPAVFSTIWTILGFPLCSVAIPTWVASGDDLPSILIAGDKNYAPLCRRALKLKRNCFPIKRGSGKKYLNLSALMNQQGNGILQKIFPLENTIIEKTEFLLSKWRIEGFTTNKTMELYDWLDSQVWDTFKKF